MAFSFTVDSRPHVIGDLRMVTGTFANDSGSTGGDITVPEHFSKIFAAGHNANAASAPIVSTEIDGTVITTITIVCGANVGGSWWAIGKR